MNPAKTAQATPATASLQTTGPGHDHAIVPNQTVSGLAAFRRPWGETYSPGDADDWAHVFCELPEDLSVPVTHTWQICRLPEGSRGQPGQLSVIRLESLPAVLGQS